LDLPFLPVRINYISDYLHLQGACRAGAAAAARQPYTRALPFVNHSGEFRIGSIGRGDDVSEPVGAHKVGIGGSVPHLKRVDGTSVRLRGDWRETAGEAAAIGGAEMKFADEGRLAGAAEEISRGRRNARVTFLVAECGSDALSAPAYSRRVHLMLHDSIRWG
jgi:hypothetical protein